MTPVEAVITACHSMGVKFTVADEYPLGVGQGPAAGGCHPTRGVYMMRHDMACGDAWAWILHELAHVVWWHPTHGADVCEKPLMAWEYAVARHFDIAGYWRCSYTTGTRIIVVARTAMFGVGSDLTALRGSPKHGRNACVAPR